MSVRTQQIIVGVTGSVACYKACELIRLLRKRGHDVTAVMTREAQQFLTPLMLRAVSANKVVTGMFAPQVEWDPYHIALAERARLVIIAPATANIIGKLAGGICDDMLTCIVVSTKAPVLIAPAMNTVMYKNKIVQDNIQKLKHTGHTFVDPVKGELACGATGMGHLAGVEIIAKKAVSMIRATSRS